jgi:hypothetical protein
MGSQSWGDDAASTTEGMTVWFVVDQFDRAKGARLVREAAAERPDTGAG